MRTTSSRAGSMAGVVAIVAAVVVLAPAPSRAVPVTACGTTLSTPGSYELTGDLACTGTGAAIDISGSGIHLDLAGHTLSGDQNEDGFGVRVVASDDFSVTNGTVTDFGTDVVVSTSADGRLADLHAGGFYDTIAGEGTFYGFYVNSSTDVVVEASSVQGTAFGIQLTASVSVPLQRITIRDNEVLDAAFTGLEVSGGAEPNPQTDNTIENNTIARSGGYNIHLGSYAQGNRIAGNRLEDAGTSGLHIASIEVRDNVVEGNRIVGNAQRGIRLTNAMEGPNTFRANVVLDNGVDMYDQSVDTDCGLQVYEDNVFETDIEGDGPTAGCITGVVPGDLAVDTDELPPAVVGMPYNATLQAVGGLSPYSWSVTAGALPAGLALASSGKISGTPESPGQSAFTVTVTDVYVPPGSADQPLTLSVALVHCHGLTPTLVGTAKSDRLVGTSGPDVIVAGSGHDIVNGRGGADVVCAGPGNDVVRGRTGPDWVDGGTGRDVLVGAAGDDRLKGRDGVDALWGGAGRDVLLGGAKRDVCAGGEGVDRLGGCELFRAP